MKYFTKFMNVFNFKDGIFVILICTILTLLLYSLVESSIPITDELSVWEGTEYTVDWEEHNDRVTIVATVNDSTSVKIDDSERILEYIVYFEKEGTNLPLVITEMGHSYFISDTLSE